MLKKNAFLMFYILWSFSIQKEQSYSQLYNRAYVVYASTLPIVLSVTFYLQKKKEDMLEGTNMQNNWLYFNLRILRCASTSHTTVFSVFDREKSNGKFVVVLPYMGKFWLYPSWHTLYTSQNIFFLKKMYF